MTAAGHLSTAFLIRSRFKDVPFWILLLASETIEFVWVILNLNLFSFSLPLEITKVNLPFLYIGDMILFQQIVSHSLLGAILIALIVSYIFQVWKKTRGIFTAVFLGVIGHWCLDLIVHDADLPVFISVTSQKLGPVLNFDPLNPELGFYSTAPIWGFCFQSFLSLVFAFVYFRSFPIQDLKKKFYFWILIFLVNLSIIGIFIKGVMTWLITSPTMMVVMVLVDIIASGILLYIATRLSEPTSV
ncbi:MAG: hypothetical protein KBF93_03010 [Leptospiraceae bacterium]|nr:hypothetical protein [Leptospiraceae bacterium]